MEEDSGGDEEPETEPMETISDGEPDPDADLIEIIPEIIPRYRSQHRSDKEWIIPEISEREVVRMMKAREPYDSGSEDPPTLEVWTDDEAYNPPGSIKITNLTRPARYEWIDAWNEYGEKFTGKVTGYRKTNPNHFYIILTGTGVGQWIDLDKLNLWEYCDPPDSALVINPFLDPPELSY